MQPLEEHIQSAHCENGVVVNLLRDHGMGFMNEPLAFGIGSGLFYTHLPFLKLNNGPAITFRTMPGAIFKRSCRLLEVDYVSKRFSKPAVAEEYLDKLLNQGRRVGCQVGVFNLSYLPLEYRFHFNAHNIVVLGKEDGHYRISDTVMEAPVKLSGPELLKARYAQGLYAPKGHVYYIADPDRREKSDPALLRKAIQRGIKRNVRDMLYIPGAFAGVSGIKYTGKRIEKWREQLGLKKAARYLGHIVRMQEEIGTGGGGFRFLYAAFLEQAADLLQNDQLTLASEDFTRAGDLWRQSAVLMAGVFKGRETGQERFREIAALYYELSELEKQGFQRLSKLNWKNVQ